MITEALLRALVQFLVFLDEYQEAEFTDQDALRQYESLTVLLEEMPEADRIEFHGRFSALIEQLGGRQKSVAADFLEGIDLLDDEES